MPKIFLGFWGPWTSRRCHMVLEQFRVTYKISYILHTNTFLKKEIAFVQFFLPARQEKPSRQNLVIFIYSRNLERKGAFRSAPWDIGCSWGALPLRIGICCFIVCWYGIGGLKEHWVVEGDLPGHVASAVVNKRGCDLLNSRIFFYLSPTWISVSGAHRSSPFLLSALRCGPRIARSWRQLSWDWASLLDLDGAPHLLAPLPVSSPPGAASLSWGPGRPTPLSQAASYCTSCL